jgi:hypothetical protein
MVACQPEFIRNMSLYLIPSLQIFASKTNNFLNLDNETNSNREQYLAFTTTININQ